MENNIVVYNLLQAEEITLLKIQCSEKIVSRSEDKYRNYSNKRKVHVLRTLTKKSLVSIVSFKTYLQIFAYIYMSIYLSIHLRIYNLPAHDTQIKAINRKLSPLRNRIQW